MNAGIKKQTTATGVQQMHAVERWRLSYITPKIQRRGQRDEKVKWVEKEARQQIRASQLFLRKNLKQVKRHNRQR